MNERDALLAEIQTGHGLLTQIQQAFNNIDQLETKKRGIGQQINQVQRSKTDYQGKFRAVRHGFLYGLPIFLVLFFVLVKLLGMRDLGFIISIIVPMLVIAALRARSRSQMEAIDKQHKEQQRQQIAALQAQIPGIDRRIASIKQQDIPSLIRTYAARCHHFPLPTWDIPSLEKMHEIISSGRADTLKEALREYDTWKHRQNMEEMQRNHLWNQNISNILQTAGLFAQAQTTAAVNRNTDAVNEQTTFIGDALANGGDAAMRNWNARHS